MYSTIGVRAAWDLQWGDTRIKPELQLGWAHQFLDQIGKIMASFAATPVAAGYQGFNVQGAQTGRDALAIAAGLTAGLGKRTRLFLSYQGLVDGDRNEHSLLGGIRVMW